MEELGEGHAVSQMRLAHALQLSLILDGLGNGDRGCLLCKQLLESIHLLWAGHCGQGRRLSGLCGFALAASAALGPDRCCLLGCLVYGIVNLHCTEESAYVAHESQAC